MTQDRPTLSLRIDFPNGLRFGPGKAALLEILINAGSINAAAKSLNMSYPRALKLIDQMNATFASPLVETQTGGSTGGGAQVTQIGVNVLALYKQICTHALSAGADPLSEFDKFLQKPSGRAINADL